MRPELSPPFRPLGELYFSDWSFEVFSPDGKWALLLQDRFGRYHVVSTQNLRAYLEGTVPPDKVEQAFVPSGPWLRSSTRTGAGSRTPSSSTRWAAKR